MSGVFTRRFGLARTALSPTSRMHFSTDFKCIWARALGVGSMGPRCAFSRRFEHTHTHTQKPLRHQPHECISASTLNAFAPCTRVWECGARFGHSQTASSPTSRMHFSTGSKCICARALGFGSAGPCRGCLHGDLGSHEPLCHQLRECISAQILNAFGPAHSGLGAWGHVALFHGDLSTHTHTNRFVTNLTNAFRHQL